MFKVQSLPTLNFDLGTLNLIGRVPPQRTTSRKVGSGFPLYLFCPKAKKDAAAILHAVLRESLVVNR
jgi:hypothetical protein